MLFILCSIFVQLGSCQNIPTYRISGATSWWPRTIQLSDKSYLTCITNYTTHSSTVHRELSIYRSTDLSQWTYFSTIWSVQYTENSNNMIDLDNCFLAQSNLYNNKVILSSFRYHTGCYRSGTNPELYCTQYSLQSSVSYDLGKTWPAKPNMIVHLNYNPPLNQQPPGLWEPFFFQPKLLETNNNNCFDIFKQNNLTNSWLVFYSQELYRNNRLEQDIRMKYSNDNGVSWSSNDFITCNVTNSRNGMPGVTQLIDGSLLIVMEGFWGPYGWGYFTINSLRSFDCGETWNDKQLLYAPSDKKYNAGAPDTMVNPENNLIFVSFMSDVTISHLEGNDVPG
eukprot:501740_1